MSRIHRYTPDATRIPKVPENPNTIVPKKAATFNKMFRWELPDAKAPLPVSVVVAGTFSNWLPLPLKYDRAHRVWQLMVENIPGNCTHHYMLLVNRKPVNDTHADGLAVPADEQEMAFALTTPRGPRLFMLYSNTR